MRTRYKSWAESYLSIHPEIVLNEQQLLAMDDFNLEIGSGKGLFLMQMGQKYPHLTFVGIERNISVSAMACQRLVESKASNVFLYVNNLDEVILKLKDESIAHIFLNFSDPWPKKRHEKRRLTHPKYLNEYLRLLKKDGTLAFKTDQKDFYLYTIEMVKLTNLEIVQQDENYMISDEFEASSDYEMNFRSQGKNIFRLVLKKKNENHN